MAVYSWPDYAFIIIIIIAQYIYIINTRVYCHVLLPGFKLTTFRSRVGHSNQQAILAPWWENFLFQSQLYVLTLIRCLFHPHVTAVACKRPRSFCQKCRWQVTSKHAYTLDPLKLEWADYVTVQEECWNLSGNKLTCNSSGNTWLQSSQLAEPLWTDHGWKSWTSLRELISTLKQNRKEAQAGNELSSIFPKSSHARKKPPPPPLSSG